MWNILAFSMGVKGLNQLYNIDHNNNNNNDNNKQLGRR